MSSETKDMESRWGSNAAAKRGRLSSRQTGRVLGKKGKRQQTKRTFLQRNNQGRKISDGGRIGHFRGRCAGGGLDTRDGNRRGSVRILDRFGGATVGVLGHLDGSYLLNILRGLAVGIDFGQRGWFLRRRDVSGEWALRVVEGQNRDHLVLRGDLASARLGGLGCSPIDGRHRGRLFRAMGWLFFVRWKGGVVRDSVRKERSTYRGGEKSPFVRMESSPIDGWATSKLGSV